MKKNHRIRRKLYSIALISSPFIALYGASPFYIFEKIDLTSYILLTLALSLNVFIVFAIHIYLYQKFPSLSIAVRFSLTYLVNIFLRLIFYFLHPLFGLTIPEFAEKYIAYPVLTSLALNAIVQVIVDSIVISHQREETESELQAVRVQHIEAQKQVLMQQLQPHFLFNALSTLKSLISQDPAKATDYTLDLSNFLRYTIQSNHQTTSTIEDELKFANDYLQLQKIRFGDAFSFTIEVDDLTKQKKIPTLALQVLMENIFKHNYFTLKNPLHFSILAGPNVLSVKNEKTTPRLTEKSGTGLANLKERYRLIGDLQIEVHETNTSFEVIIPYLTE
jgi:two-component system, LytTR family, sensor kinase